MRNVLILTFATAPAACAPPTASVKAAAKPVVFAPPPPPESGSTTWIEVAADRAAEQIVQDLMKQSSATTPWTHQAGRRPSKSKAARKAWGDQYRVTRPSGMDSAAESH